MKQSEKSYKKIVIKIGSSLFYSEKENLTLKSFDELVQQISSLIHEEKKEIIIVSSGAIALGMSVMGLKARPKTLPSLQAVAAIGQNALMDNYSRALRVASGKIQCAQVLLTWDDFDDRRRYLNAKNTLLTLLSLGSLPVVNENDTISTEEIKFGDNDKLSARVATLVNADLLIMLSDVDGLLDKERKLVRIVDEINSEVKNLACPTNKKTCVGGMITKVEAAKIAVDSGIPCIIANGRQKQIISSVLGAQDLVGNWTLFLPKKSSLAARERWIAFGTKPKGKVVVDEGAKTALLNKKSLLSVGIADCEGIFEVNDTVSLLDLQGNEFARGKIGFSSKKLKEIKGRHCDKEVIHCDNIAIL